MSAPVDVLDVLDPASHLGVKQSANNGNAGFVDMRDWGAYLGRTKDASAAVAELIEAAEAFDALIADRERFIGCLSDEMRVVYERNRAALARVKGGAA